MISAPLGRFVPKYSIIRCPATGLMGKDQPSEGEREDRRQLSDEARFMGRGTIAVADKGSGCLPA
jgi:hypothetical protein